MMTGQAWIAWIASSLPRSCQRKYVFSLSFLQNILIFSSSFHFAKVLPKKLLVFYPFAKVLPKKLLLLLFFSHYYLFSF